MAYTGVSITDYLNSVGQASDYASRAKLAASKGISGYAGTADQNTQLLNMLRGSGAPAPAAPQSAPQQVPQAVPQQQYAQPSYSQPSAPQNITKGSDQEARAAGYKDYSDYELQTARRQETAGGGLQFNQPTINLPELYQKLFDSSGIKDIEGELSAKSRAYTEQVAKIKDNPYLSEATMTGRLSKLDDKFNADSQNIRNDIAMRKADIETKLNLETKQFDINSQQAQQAWSQFNSLLNAGALDNASGEDIANLTKATGISSSMIQSAIGTSKAKNAPKLNTQVIQVDDGNEVSAVVINQDTGEVINRQVIGASTPTAAESKAASGGGGASKAEIKVQETQQNTQNLITDIKGKKTLNALITYYSQVLPIADIYRLYNTYSPYGKAKETLAQVKQGKFVSK